MAIYTDKKNIYQRTVYQFTILVVLSIVIILVIKQEMTIVELKRQLATFESSLQNSKFRLDSLNRRVDSLKPRLRVWPVKVR